MKGYLLGVLALLSVGLSSVRALAQEAPDYSELCKWDEKKYPRGGRDRVVRELTLTRTSTDETEKKYSVSVAGRNATVQEPIYFDKTETEVEVTSGDAISLKVEHHNLHWTHFYLYIDYNRDGRFDVEGGELVSFTHFSKSGQDADYVDSKGKKVFPGIVAGTLPTFEIPATAKIGKMRARFKADWNSQDPCGNMDPNNRLSANRGTICDFTIEVKAAEVPVPTFAVTTDFVAEQGSLTLRTANGQTLASGTKIASGTPIIVEVAPKPDFQLEQLLVNGVDRTSGLINNKLTLAITEMTTITATFKEVVTKTFVVTTNYDSKQGRVRILNRETNKEIPVWTPIKHKTKIWIEVVPNEGYEVSLLLVNNQEFKDGLVDNRVPYAMEIDTHVEVTFSLKKYPVKVIYDKHKVDISIQANGEPVRDFVTHGARVEIFAKAKSGYDITAFKVNNEDQLANISPEDEYTLTVVGSLTVEVEAAEAAKMQLSYRVANPEGGTLEFKRADGTLIPSGSQLPRGTEIALIAKAKAGYVLQSLVVNELLDLLSLTPNMTTFEQELPLDDNMSFVLTFAKTTSLTEPTVSTAKVYGAQGHIIVEGADAGSQVLVYDLTGRRVATVVAQAAKLQIPVANSSIYVVSVVSAKATSVHKVRMH